MQREMSHQRIYGGFPSAHLNLGDWLHSPAPANISVLETSLMIYFQEYNGWSLGVLNMSFQGEIYHQKLSHSVLLTRIGITPTLLWLVQSGCSRCLLKKAEMLDVRAQ